MQQNLSTNFVELYNSAYIDDDGYIDFKKPIDIFVRGDYKRLDLRVDKDSLYPYEKISKLDIDIETTGLNPVKESIFMIGGIDNDENITIFRDGSERDILMDWFDYLKKVDPKIIMSYNGHEFDIPFIITRCEILKIKQFCPFKYSTFTDGLGRTQHRMVYHVGATELYQSECVQYRALKCEINGHRVDLIDVYHSVLDWDRVNHKLDDSASLKNVPTTLELREADDRTYLSFTEMQKLRLAGEWEKLDQYLVDDLKDTRLISDFLVPQIYYQRSILTCEKTWPLQRIATAGEASKWNWYLTQVYPDAQVEPDAKVPYRGGLTKAQYGLFFKVGKLDVKSLYPTLLGDYGITTAKDPLSYLPSIVHYLKVERLKLKDSGKKIKRDAQIAGSFKINANAAYGLLGSGQPYNDPISAAIVTRYGQEILKFMATIIEQNGGYTIEWDTDGIYYVAESFDNLQEIFKLVEKALPEWVEIDYEVKATAMYVPAKTVKVTGADGKKQKIFTGQKKNYIIVMDDGRTKATGKYKKRDKYALQKYFPIKLVKAFTKSEQHGIAYYDSILRQLKTRKIPVEDLIVTRKARVNEKAVFELGLVNEDGASIYYMGERIRPNLTSRMKKKTEFYKTQTGDYAIEFYIDEVKAIYTEIYTAFKNRGNLKKLSEES